MTFLNGNIDVVTKILEFVTESSEELNTYAMVSRDFRLARNDSRLDQTRTGTIIIKTIPSDILPEVWQRWNQHVFIGNCVRLVAIFTQIPRSMFIFEDSFALTNVSKVVLQVKAPDTFSLEYEHGGLRAAVDFFKKISPNLDILDIGALAVTTPDQQSLRLNYPDTGLLNDLRASIFRCNAAKVIRHGCYFTLMQPCPVPVNNANSLHEIHIDPFGVYLEDWSLPFTAYCQEYSQLEREHWFAAASGNNGGADWVLLQEYPNLKRVTLKHSKYTTMIQSGWKAIPQEALMKFVRHTPNLRWFCSELTQENIAILKEERPEVEFCN